MEVSRAWLVLTYLWFFLLLGCIPIGIFHIWMGKTILGIGQIVFGSFAFWYYVR